MRSKSISHKYLTDWSNSRWDKLQSVSEQTELTTAELLRRAFDYVFQDKILNEIVPSMSGQINTFNKREI